MQQTVRRQRAQIFLVSFHCQLAWTVTQLYLLDRERAHFPWNFLSGDRFAIMLKRIDDWILQRKSYCQL
jgi:hypothetical protein